MYFSRAVLRHGVTPTALGRHMPRDGYGVHQLVWQLFKGTDENARDFLYREEHVDNCVAFHLVSARQPVDLGGLWLLQSKPYAPRLHTGDRLRFQLRANAVRSKRDEVRGTSRRHDVVMCLKKDLLRQFPGTPLPSLPRLMQQAGVRWLMERASSHGFQVEEDAVMVDGYRKHRFLKGRQRAAIQISTLDLSGVLLVTDPDLFLKTLYHGIGHAKGFGCGLLMVRRS